MRRTLTLAVLPSLLLLAGCSGPVPMPPVSGSEEDDSHAGSTTIEDTGDLLVGDEATWEWHVPEGYQDFQVRFDVSGPGGLPVMAGHGVRVWLEGGSGEDAVQVGDTAPATGIRTPASPARPAVGCATTASRRGRHLGRGA